MANIFVYWSAGLEAGHFTVIVGTEAGHLPTKIAGRAGHLTFFFQCPGFARGRDARGWN